MDEDDFESMEDIMIRLEAHNYIKAFTDSLYIDQFINGSNDEPLAVLSVEDLSRYTVMILQAERLRSTVYGSENHQSHQD